MEEDQRLEEPEAPESEEGVTPPLEELEAPESGEAVAPVQEEPETPEFEEVVAPPPVEPAPPPEIGEPEEGAFEVEAMEPSRFGRLLRSLLRWSAGLLVVFALGILATWLIRVRPQSANLAELRSDLDAAQGEISALQSEVNALRPLRGENTALKEELESTVKHLDLLRVLVDVTSARLALEQEDPTSARAALGATDDRLEALEAGLTGQNAQTVGGMRDRLVLVLDELETDAFAARRDLEILANNLLALERSLFTEP